MSPRLDVNFGDVPEVIKPIEPGVYELEVAKVPAIEPTSKGTGQNFIVDFRVTTEGEFFGRSIRDYIFISDMGLTTIKQLMLGCGMPADQNGINTEEFLGKKVKAILVASSYKDPETGQTNVNAKIKSFLFDKAA